jgi:phosphate-selective porin OprO and OprP
MIGRAEEPLTLQQLAAKVQEQQAQIQQLQTQLQQPTVAPTPPTPTFLPRDLFLHRSTNGGEDYKPRVNVIGRLHIDAQFAEQTSENLEQVGDLQNTVGFRRARLGAEGDIHRDVYWKAEFDFAGGVIAFRDVYVALRHLPVVNEIRLGHFREPFSLEAATSSNNITFLERSTINQFDPGRNWGLGVFNHTSDERITWSLGAFRSGSDRAGNVNNDASDLAYTARVTAVPLFIDEESEYRMMHVGGAISYRTPPDNLVQFAPQRQLVVPDDSPPSPVTVPLQIPSNHWEIYNVQWAYVHGPWSLQAEWTGANINQLGGNPVFLHGCYVQMSYFLTGEHRTYDRQMGTFDGVEVRKPWNSPSGFLSGWGAWEAAWRFDFLDTSDPDIPVQPDGNARVQNIYTSTVGLNWYLNNYTRLMSDYTLGVPVGHDFNGALVHLFGLRFAIHW